MRAGNGIPRRPKKESFFRPRGEKGPAPMPPKPAHSFPSRFVMTRNKAKWAALRLIFYAYLGFSILSVVGGFLTAPLMSHYFFGDWRFWRHWNHGWRLFPHAWRMLWLIVKGDNDGFMFSVRLTSPPHNAPLPSRVRLAPDWKAGSSCGECTRCCDVIQCPVLEKGTGLCRGYDSFFWRYFNCGRFPSYQSEIDYYACPKWVMAPGPFGAETPAPFPLPPGEEPLTTID